MTEQWDEMSESDIRHAMERHGLHYQFLSELSALQGRGIFFHMTSGAILDSSTATDDDPQDATATGADVWALLTAPLDIQRQAAARAVQAYIDWRFGERGIPEGVDPFTYDHPETVARYAKKKADE